MDPREQRGLMIAATTNLTKDRGLWSVPSQSNGGKYRVNVFEDGSYVHCTCPDFESRGLPCKHIFAVQFTMKRETTKTIETDANGKTTVTETETVTETVKVTYAQNWTAYNLAQQNEKRLFLPLLRDLCQTVEEPAYEHGRPRLPLCDMVFASAYKVYSTVSGRRFASDLQEAADRGFIAKAPHFNSVFNCLEMESLTPQLQALIALSASPLRGVETKFAVDSSGFGTCRHETWVSVKHGGKVSKRDWAKVHLCCGVTTNIVTAAVVSDRDANDMNFLPGLVGTTAEQFQIAEVSADKGYSSRKNHEAVANVGGTPYIMFKTNTTGNSPAKAEGGELWNKMFHMLQADRTTYLKHYHLRSNVESTFSMVKAKFGDALRSKSDTAQVNESLLKILCHNICVVISAIYELGIDPKFVANAN